MDFYLRIAQLRMGAVFRIRKYVFPNGEIRNKYAIVMERPLRSTTDVIIVLSTSHCDNKPMDTCVSIPANTYKFWDVDTIIELENHFLIPIATVLDINRSTYVGDLSKEHFDECFSKLDNVITWTDDEFLRVVDD